ncbi:MAG: molybdenum cofactor guanylyltransferase [Bacteroidota bacterium]|nr:molybdenum cofactor guanylyltransferase [Bacteroidota bacterium]
MNPVADPSQAADLIGVVLCGGESSRMGRDKGSLLRNGTPWALVMAGLLDSLHIPVLFSINPAQAEQYASFIPIDRLVPDTSALAGPLKGLLSVHERFPSKDILLLACDMLDLDEATIVKVLDARRADDRHDFYVYADNRFAQPFCGIYTARGLAPISRSAATRTDLSLQSLLKGGNTLALEVERSEAFGNYNALP